MRSSRINGKRFSRMSFAAGTLPLWWIMFNILCWNCRGACKKETGNFLRHLIGEHNISIIGLVETKMETFSRADADKLAGRNWDLCFQPSVGRAGGILVLWLGAIGTFNVTFQMNQCIMGSFRWTRSPSWKHAVVYVVKDRYTRQRIWEDISQHHVANAPLVVVGDFNCIMGGGHFNCIMAKSEKKGGRPFVFNPVAGDIGDFMNANGLIDPGFSVPAFTWTNNKDAGSRIYSRLDQFLISSSILDEFQGLKVKHLSRLTSDHCPILFLIQAGGRRAYSSWIRFEDVWASYPRAWQLVT
ncbi:uncharacterized protein LOC110105495 [Dendrobium catenatum]|uniref:uncharacterized protein LOC110105495 n=1 Tax=Dendrobium catenatum TaxID=906689 RepID=UPI0009F3A8A6|nr:uncharacterized protein LOC110105495 [Dendrobium catenatum]